METNNKKKENLFKLLKITFNWLGGRSIVHSQKIYKLDEKVECPQISGSNW